MQQLTLVGYRNVIEHIDRCLSDYDPGDMAMLMCMGSIDDRCIQGRWMVVWRLATAEPDLAKVKVMRNVNATSCIVDRRRAEGLHTLIFCRLYLYTSSSLA